jgi:hypothetical protein
MSSRLTLGPIQPPIQWVPRAIYLAVKPSGREADHSSTSDEVPCGGGFEYLHRDPASRRRRRKGNSQIGDSKMWSRVPRDSNPRKTTLARTISIYKRPTPLVREGAPQKQDRNCQKVINIWSWAPDGVRHQDLLIDWPSVAMSLWLWLWLWSKSSRYHSEISERFFIAIRQTNLVQKEFNVWAVMIDCNCKEVPINPIIKSRSHYY